MSNGNVNELHCNYIDIIIMATQNADVINYYRLEIEILNTAQKSYQKIRQQKRMKILRLSHKTNSSVEDAIKH